MWLLGTSLLEKLFRESNGGTVKRLYITKLDYWYTHKFGNVLYSRKVWTATTADNWMCAYHYRRPYQRGVSELCHVDMGPDYPDHRYFDGGCLITSVHH